MTNHEATELFSVLLDARYANDRYYDAHFKVGYLMGLIEQMMNESDLAREIVLARIKQMEY